jgi:RNA polymerase sigma-70 factor, ECF subfamily
VPASVSLENDQCDELLVLACRQGDAAALEMLLARWQERLWRHALRVTGDSEAAWDVLQDSMLAIARQIRRLEDESLFGIWAYRITANKAKDWVRRHVRRRRHEAHYGTLRHDQIAEPEEMLPDADRLQEMIRRLPPHEQNLLTLRFTDGFSNDEIAHMLGIPAGTVKSRLHYLRQRLRISLENKHE